VVKVPVKRHTVAATVAEVVRQRIIVGFYGGGEQIRQEALANELGVSRIPVREALLLLEQEGLVVIHTHKGAIVTTLSRNDAEEVFEARRLIEPFLVGIALLKATQADVENIRQAKLAYEDGLGSRSPPAQLSDLNWKFHRALCLPAQRPRAFTMLTDMHNAVDRYLRLQIELEGAQARAAEQHEHIFEAFALRNRELCVSLTIRHVEAAASDVFQELRH
jgi:DNA-binding GntR family transcriptional regulator